MIPKKRALNPSARIRDQIGPATIRTLAAGVLGESVFFTVGPSSPEAGQHLAAILMQALGQIDPLWRILPDNAPLTIQKSPLGQPRLFIGDRPGPSLSLSHGEGQTWAAICGAGNIGIDVAFPGEFADDYPFARAFSLEELDIATALCDNDVNRGAALIWSAKEATVKATGAGFNRLDPLEVRVGRPLFKPQGICFEVLADHAIPTWVTPEGQGWCAIALSQ